MHSEVKENSETKKVIISSLKMSVATFLSRILGLVREQVMAAMFGAGGLTDAFHVAYRIPNLMRDLFAEGAFSAAFVPNFIESLQKGKKEARQLLWSLFILLTLVTGCIGLGIYFFSDQIVHLFAPNFALDPAKFEITSNLTKIMSFYLMFVSLAALFMGVLNSLKMFFIPALAPALFNIVMIASMLFLAGNIGANPIYALGIGVLIGGVCQFALQLPLVLKKGLSLELPDKILNPQSKKVFKLLGPGLFGFAATQINILVTTILATGTVVGAVSWLQYAFRLFQLPVGVASVSIGNTNLVHFSESWKAGKKAEAVKFLASSYHLSAFVLAPAVAALVVFPEEMINIIFQRGKFLAIDTSNTAQALRMYAIGLPAYGIYKIFVPTFYAMDRQKIPVLASIFSIAVNIVFCTLMVPKYGFSILALGTSLSMLINAFIQSIFLNKDLKLGFSFFISKKVLKVVVALSLTIGVSYLVKTLIAFYGGSFVIRGLILAFELVLLSITYIISLYVLGEKQMIQQVIKRFKR
jgi:putative peptidoglycan lipid II flippase